MSIGRGKRWKILERDDFTCRYCGRRAPSVVLEIDHVVPRSRGGTNHESNLVSACEDCNGGKSARPLRAPNAPPVEWELAAERQRELAFYLLVEIMGETAFGFGDEEHEMDEVAAMDPYTLYGVAKRFRENGTHITGIRTRWLAFLARCRAWKAAQEAENKARA